MIGSACLTRISLQGWGRSVIPLPRVRVLGVVERADPRVPADHSIASFGGSALYKARTSENPLRAKFAELPFSDVG
jgi:hypothetical protein